jgi:hypothetical protein
MQQEELNKSKRNGNSRGRPKTTGQKKTRTQPQIKVVGIYYYKIYTFLPVPFYHPLVN